jgi:hypothetical protein
MSSLVSEVRIVVWPADDKAAMKPSPPWVNGALVTDIRGRRGEGEAVREG